MSVIGEIIVLSHNIRNILNIFDPTTLPIAISDFFFIIATIEVVSSGKDVHKATIVKPITDCHTQKNSAIVIAPFTIHCPHKIKPISPTTI